MRRLRSALLRLSTVASAARRRRLEEAFDEELRCHLELHVDDCVRSGMTLQQARREAQLKLGGIEAVRQRRRERASVPRLDHLAQDVRFAVRQLRRAPAFTATAIATLSLGFAAALSIFAFVDAVLVRPLPYADPSRLVSATGRTPEIPHGALSHPDYVDWKRTNTVFEALEAHRGGGGALATPEGLHIVPIARVTAGFFRVLGVQPALGRDFLPGEDAPGAARVVILSHASWQGRFGGAPDIVGQSFTVSNEMATIVGVLPSSFHFAPRGHPELWMPLQATSGCDVRRSCHAMGGVARLKDGVTLEHAQAELSAIAAALERQYPESNRGQGASVRALGDEIVGDLQPTLLALLGGAVMLLAIAWVNVISLLLVRADARTRELAVRSTLGASRARLMVQFLVEAGVLVGVAMGAGVLLSSLTIRLLTGLVSQDVLERLPFLGEVSVSTHVLLAATGLAVLSIALAALAPSVRAGAGELRDGLTEGARGSSGTGWRRLGFRLVVAEVAIAMVLLVGAALLGQSLYRVLTVELGFAPARVASVAVAAVGTRFDDERAVVRLARQVEARVAALPGVRRVGLTSVLPVSFNGNTDWIRIVGRPWNGRHLEVNMREVSAGYFAAIGAPLVRGRGFSPLDTAERPKVAVINRTLAAAHFGSLDPIGQRFGDRELTPDSIKEIVGVVDDIREGPLDAEIWPAVYYPFEQSGSRYFAVVARTASDEGGLLPSLHAAIREIDPDVGTRDGTVMDDHIGDSPVAALRRSSATLAGGFAVLAVFLCLVGVYGVVAYSVGRRTREIGLRVAMGAERRAIYAMVLGQALRVVALGLVLGILGAVASARLMRALLFATSPWDVPTLVAAAAVLAAAALVASYIPARRAASVNPIEALRIE